METSGSEYQSRLQKHATLSVKEGKNEVGKVNQKKKRTVSLGHELDGTGNERVGEPVYARYAL